MADANRIIECISRSLPPGSRFVEEMPVAGANLDSLRLSQIVLDIEEEFEVRLDDREVEMIFSYSTLGEIANGLEESLKNSFLRRNSAV